MNIRESHKETKAGPSEIVSARGGEIRRYFDECAGAVVSLARTLVETESPSGDAEGSRAVVSLLEDAARACGALTSFERIAASEGYGEHLRAGFFGGGATGEGALLIIGHTDTVHPRGSVASRPWREEGGRLYGPGVFDMKAACALAFEVMRACETLKLAPRGEVVILLTCDEETGSTHGGRELVEGEARRARAALVLEPPAPGSRVKTARKGTGHYVVRAHGVPAHAGLEPEKGASAVLEIARQIERLHASGDAARGTTVNVGVVAGGTRSNVVAAEARAEVDVRFSTMDEARRVGELILNLRPFDERVRLIVEGEVNRPPLERGEGVARLYETARACAALLGQELGEASVGGASDGNFAAAVGAPVLDGLGVPGDGAHAFHEHVESGAVATRGALLAALVASL